jgi:uncharacterized membrane protein
VGQISDSRLFRGVIAFLLTLLALICGIYGVLVLVQVFNGHGSSEGNAYLFTFGLILLIFFPITFAFAIHYWKSCKACSGNECP